VQHASGSTVGQRLLGNQFLGKVVVEGGNQHTVFYEGNSFYNPSTSFASDRGTTCGTIQHKDLSQLLSYNR
jgi:hypothetical protein